MLEALESESDEARMMQVERIVSMGVELVWHSIVIQMYLAVIFVPKLELQCGKEISTSY